MKGFKGCDATNHLQIWLKLNFWAVKYNYLINYQSCWGKSALYIDLILSLLNSQTLTPHAKIQSWRNHSGNATGHEALISMPCVTCSPMWIQLYFSSTFSFSSNYNLRSLKKKGPLMFSWRFLRSNSRSQTTDCSRMVQSTNVPPDSALWNCKISGRLLLINNMVDHWRIFLTNSPAPAGSANKIWSQVYQNSAWDT